MTLETQIPIRMIQHYMYCPRRYALLELNRDWEENAAVVNANIIHETVHSDKPRYMPKGIIAENSVSVWNDELSIYGVCDCVEFVPDKNGVEIAGHSGRYRVKIIEYKPTAPKNEPFHSSDAIQVYAQKICADKVWSCDCEAYIYYDSTRKRVKLPFDTDEEYYHGLLLQYISEMKKISESHVIPPCRKGQVCSGCSLYNICFPKNPVHNVRKMIGKIWEE